jgi:hypothetical protein
MTSGAMGLLIVAFLTPAARADILEWDDAEGVRHYTNLKSEVPSQQTVQVVVDEQVWLPQSSSLPPVEEQPVAQKEPPRDTTDDMLRAYLAGLESGLASSVNTGGAAYVNEPLTVTTSPAPPYAGGYVPPAYDWLLPGYYPFVTSSVIGAYGAPIRAKLDAGFRKNAQFPKRFTSLAGPPPLGAAGPPPLGAAGPPPLGILSPPLGTGDRSFRR